MQPQLLAADANRSMITGRLVVDRRALRCTRAPIQLDEAFAGGGGVDLDVVPEVEGSLQVVVLLPQLGMMLRRRRRRSRGGGQHARLRLEVVAARVERRRQRLQLRRRRRRSNRRRRHLLVFCRLLLSSLDLCNLFDRSTPTHSIKIRGTTALCH